ncbi:mucin-5AC-like isoform X1 [Ascaphus truei]|uniref:mucin-5AC-like isoform X1 n=3 Tax=Ascaphus truei TaxID=8439 RepID=UPI003F5904DB
MDFNARSPGKLCVLIWIFSFLKQTGLAQNHSAPPMLMTSPTLIAAVVRPLLTNHNGQVCSTWGNFHYKTFDGEIFNFPGTCNYIFSSHCKGNYEDFNIQIRRTMVNSIPTISHITIKIDAVVVEMFNKSIMVDGVIAEKLPLGQSKIHIERSGVYLKIVAKLGLVFMWNEDDSMLMELNTKYTNQTCGLCGDFNGISGYSEFMFNGIKLNPVQFGNLQQLDGPMEDCNNPTPIPQDNCLDQEKICERILLSSAFSSCNKLVEADPYIKACVQDLCHCNSENHSCLCNTFAEYSRQCAHAGGQPEKWRTQELCFRKCPFNMEHKECGSPCADSCSNPERALVCEDHCIDGCICPTGTVLDDINHTGCIPQEECFCVYNSEIYSPGSSYSTPCRACTCSRGKWKCKEIPCTGSCSIEGGSHITTFDQTHYTVHGDCSYVLVKLCNQSNVMVQAEMYRCGLSERNTCLKSVMLGLQGGQTVVVIKPSGHVFFNWMVTQLPISAANVTIFRPSSFYIIVQTTLGLQLQIQLTPIMQVHMILDPSYQDQTCGLCGNFNNVQTDDFRAISGLIEGTAAAFANTWKTQFDCPNIKNIYEDPCSFSVENERYAQHWCALLTDPAGPFAQCHSLVNPLVYHSKCLFATCSCKDSEDCMCAALSSYVYACAKKGIALLGWRATVCKKYTESCEKSQTYSYSVTRCQPTCRARSETDVTCGIEFVPVDGCVCIEGFYMDDSGTCVMPSSCPCYYKGIAMESGEMFQENGLMCICNLGQLSCVGGIIENPACSPPMVYFDCTNVTVGTKGAECQKSCHTLDMDCYSSQCVSGCICPQGLVSDGRGSCIFEQECPCIHNEATYLPGENIAVGCNTCTCMARRWHCTHKACLGTCAVYGNGHYITFDGKHYGFSGDCEYTLAQDHGGQGGSTFRVITENIPCGTTGTACSKDIKIFLGGYELLLDDAKFEVVKRNETNPIRYEVQNRGIYLVIRAGNGLVLMWDKKTSIFIKLSPDFKGKVCGLCGNYDGNANNDFTTRSQSVVENEMEFFNSWKLSPTCPDVLVRKDPCLANPYRKPWAQKQCGIITSKTFLPCHSQVDPVTYYEACISDACTCDAGGDCECFCTAVASYAQACGEAGVCIKWRTPTICPLFCDYYNTAGECEWHYKPCGFPCMKTCRNLKGVCQYDLPGSEGCYPICPANKPYFNEDTLKCVSQCGCYDHEGNLHNPGEKWFLPQNCHSCECTLEGLACGYDIKACRCEYGGKIYHYMDRIDGVEGCNSMICDGNGTIVNITSKCSTTVLPSSLPNQIETTSGKAPYSYQTEKPPSPTSTSSAIIRTSTLSTTSIDTKSSTSSTSASPVTRETNSPLTMSLVSKSRSNPPSSTTAISKGTSISPTITRPIPTCKVEEMWTIVQYGDCLANVTLTHCEGLCSSLSRYSPSSKKIEHNCSCCQESSTSIKEIQLECGDGTSVGYTYKQMEECHCQQSVCDLGA